jgi:hypothetical protein
VHGGCFLLPDGVGLVPGGERCILPARIFWKKGKKRFKNFLKQCIIKLPLKNGEAGRVFSA